MAKEKSSKSVIKECCGTCRHRQYSTMDSGWICMNQKSDSYVDWVDYGYWCEEYERK